jgi:SGNH hydrolase-like domain, acetyltransferase AlgX
MRYLTSRGAGLGVVGAVATAFVFGPAAAWALGVSPRAIENRALSPAPVASDGWDALDTLAPWATDHLPGRADAVHLNAWVDYNVLGQLPANQQLGTKGSASSPTVVRGKDGYLFYGKEFTSACDGMTRYEHSLKSVAELAEIIRASGRRVVFSIAPNKSSVTTDELPRAIPRGTCAARAIERQNELLDNLQDPLYVGIRRALDDAHASGKQVYLRTDTHWTKLGSAMYAQAVAARLDPELAGRLRLYPVRISAVGDLTKLIGLTSPELVTSVSLSSGGTVLSNPAAATAGVLKANPRPVSWVTRPSDGLVQGRTLLLGDSFTNAALASLQPLFADGRFVSVGRFPERLIVGEIESSDTVVIEVVQRDVVGHLFTQPRFHSQVAAALGVPNIARDVNPVGR